jgi:hypothetical protein
VARGIAKIQEVLAEANRRCVRTIVVGRLVAGIRYPSRSTISTLQGFDVQPKFVHVQHVAPLAVVDVSRTPNGRRSESNYIITVASTTSGRLDMKSV